MPKAPLPSEKQIQSSILDYLGMLRDAYVWRNNSGSGRVQRKNGYTGYIKFGLEGSADIIGCYMGRFIAIEAKSAKGKTSSEQDRFIEEINRCGGYAIVARSLDDAKALIANINYDIDRVYMHIREATTNRLP